MIGVLRRRVSGPRCLLATAVVQRSVGVQGQDAFGWLTG
jgi:hypothetical protein